MSIEKHFDDWINNRLKVKVQFVWLEVALHLIQVQFKLIHNYFES